MKAAVVLTFLFLASLATADSPSLTAIQKLTVEQLTSIFENSTREFQYSYIEDIGDGAGVTCGRVGFTGDELGIIVSRYVSQKTSKTPLAQYLPCLQKMGDAIEQDYSCLFPSLSKAQMNAPDFKSKGITEYDFGKAWSLAGLDPVMQAIQDKYVEETYFDPAMQEFKNVGLHTALGVALLYDTIIQMDSVHEIEAYAQNKFKEKHSGRIAPQSDLEEQEWLSFYQEERAAILLKTAVGAGTVPRVESLNQILRSGNMDLKLPFTITYFGDSFTLDGTR